jgi:LmbE family N-acetylglucosaminyl deacetylase
MQDNGRVLAFGCHPDDVEFTCAGTLALLREQGYQIHVATVTRGDMGSMVLPRDEIGAIRLQECRDAAQVLDASYRWAGWDDIEISFCHELRVNVARILREVDPFLVFTQPPADYMVDHEETSRLVRNACFCASMPNFEVAGTEPTSGVPYLYYTDAMEGKDILGRPAPVGMYVDISSTIDLKADMLGRHRSQRDWLYAQHGMDQYIHHMRAWAAHRGHEIGVSYAEVFCQHLGHAYPQDNVLLELLGSLCQPGEGGVRRVT